MKKAQALSSVFLLLLCLGLGLGQAHAKANCGRDEAGFGAWLAAFKKEAAAQGISENTLKSALGGVQYSDLVISRDRNQKSFKLSFDAFWRLRVNQALINKGRQLKKQHAGLFAKIEQRYGVPAEILLAIWGLETSYGSYRGEMLPIFPSLATLAYDCRRTDFFTKELMSALRIVQRGQMSPSKMRGAWAGEIGQTQFMASSYEKYAVDFDGNGHPDLINSVADVLASTANFLKGHGWKAGASWESGTNNAVLREWNKAEVYCKTIAKMATAMKD